MRTVQTQVFKFAELSNAAKERAKAWYAEGLDRWWDSSFEDAKQIGALLGFEIDNIYFSGFSSQGDGAKFEGSFSYAKGCVKAVKSHAPLDTTLHAIAEEWAAIQKANFYKVNGKVKCTGRYQHSGETDFEVYRDSVEVDADLEERVAACIRSFMDWVYTQLEKEYDGINTDQYIADYMEANGFEFEADGSVYAAAEAEEQPAGAEREYYLVKTGPNRWDMRQTRFRDQLQAGKEHPNDICATGFDAEGIRRIVAAHNFDVDLTELDAQTIDVERATPDIIAKAVQESDLDAACLIIQNAIGQTQGDVAGLYFSCLDSVEQWAELTADERLEHLLAYVAAERERLTFN